MKPPTVPRQRPAPRPPLDAAALWRLARVGAPSLAPDGRFAVAAVTQPDAAKNTQPSALWRFALDGRSAPRRLTWCGEKDGTPSVSPRGDLIAFLARRGGADAPAQIHLLPADGGEAWALTDFAPGLQALRWAPDGRSLLAVAWLWPDTKTLAGQTRRHRTWRERQETGHATSEAFHRWWDHAIPAGRVPHLLRVRLGVPGAPGRVDDLFAGTGLSLPWAEPGVHHFAAHPDGTRVAFVHDPLPLKLPDGLHVLSELDLKTRRVRTLAATPGWHFGAPAYSPCGRYLACTAAERGRVHTAPDRPALVTLDAPPHWRLLTGDDWDHEADAPLRWSDDGRALFFAAEQRGRRPLWRLDLDSGACRVVLPGGWVQGFDLRGPAEDALLVTSQDSALHPPQLHAHRPGRAAAPQRLDRFNDRLLAAHTLGAVREVAVTGALDEPVQMWLVHPAGFDAQQRHAVMHVIHGGPFAAAGDTWSWRWNPHVLASRGAVVAQVNYHGSSGFGQAFKHSLVGRQGALELQDLEAATDWLLRQRWVDARRVFATGGSYGGFLVAWMNGHVSPGRYRAYVCHAGVFDRVATFSADSWRQRPKDLGALYWQDLPRVLAQSPHAFAAQMRTPTLVMHGAKDYRVPDCNGLAYYNTLHALGVPARLLWFADENHWILKPANSLQWHREFLAWIAAHDPGPRRRP